MQSKFCSQSEPTTEANKHRDRKLWGCYIFVNVRPQVTGKCGSVVVRLIPAPRGTGIVSAPVPKKLLNMAGIDDCYTSARGQTATLGNFGEWQWMWQANRNVRDAAHVKFSLDDTYVHFDISAKATYAAIANTYSYLTPDLWKETTFTKSPYQEFTDYLAKNHTRVSAAQRQAQAQAMT